MLGSWGGGEHSLADYDYSSSLLDKTARQYDNPFTLHITAIFLPRIFHFNDIDKGVSACFYTIIDIV